MYIYMYVCIYQLCHPPLDSTAGQTQATRTKELSRMSNQDEDAGIYVNNKHAATQLAN